MRRTFQFQKFLDRLFLYIVVIFLSCMLVDFLKPNPLLRADHYFDCCWAFVTSIALELIFSLMGKNFKRALAEENKGPMHRFVSGTFLFFGVWLLMLVSRDALQTQSEYPEVFHYGVGIAVLLAFGLTLKDCFNAPVSEEV